MVYSIHKAIAAQLDISIDDVSIANINYLPRSDGGLSPIVNPAFLKRVGSQLLINEYENEKTFDYRIDYGQKYRQMGTLGLRTDTNFLQAL